MICDYDIMDSLSVAAEKESKSVGFGDECFLSDWPGTVPFSLLREGEGGGFSERVKSLSSSVELLYHAGICSTALRGFSFLLSGCKV